jgi:indolepyruvate ferredoxin oxidoreductase beta subunit
MVPEGEADYLLVLEETQVEVNRAMLKPGGVLIDPTALRGHKLRSEKSINVALLGALSCCLGFPEEAWIDAILAHLAPKLHTLNRESFQIGRDEWSH